MDNDNADRELTAPFTARLSGVGGYELTDANGIVAIWVVGEVTAAIVVAALNEALG